MRIFAALALSFSVQAFACPDLAGTYTCKYQDDSSESVTISQEQTNGVTVYNLIYGSSPSSASKISADNQPYLIPDDENLKQASYRAWCDTNDSNVLQTQLTGKYYAQGSFHGDLTLSMSYSRSGADLKQVNQGTLKTADGQSPLGSVMLCTRE
jgi:hypothetical protein